MTRLPRPRTRSRPTAAERLQKYLARAGLGSRRACEDLIRTGRVTVNGSVAALGSSVEAADQVQVDGLAIRPTAELTYVMLNKPVGVVTTASDERGRRTVLDLVPSDVRLFPVGRLDKDSGGLLLLTNDGAFAVRMTHPRYGVSKTYIAEVSGTAKPSHARRLLAGVRLEDGTARAARAQVRAASAARSAIEIEIHEGRNRIVRRMLDAVGLPVTGLTRVAVGPLRLGRLRPGDSRELSRTEVADLWRSADGP